MVSFTVFGGAEIEMEPTAQVVVTLFGGTEIFCPTVTQHLLQLTDEESPSSPWSRREASRRSNLYVTIFGGTSIHRPPLAREYLDLRNLLASESIELGDFQVLWLQHTTQPLRRHFRTVTIFGSCELSFPGKRTEMKELESLLSRQALRPEEYEALQALVGEDRNAALGSLLQIATQFLPAASAGRA